MKLISNLDEAFNGIADLTKALHFETDEKRAEEMKIELGRRQGEVTRTKQIEGGEYSLRRFRKEIKFGDGTYLGVFLPGSYDAATSTLGDGPHKKAVKKIKWNQKKYDQWLEDVASNDGWKNAYDMAQNAKHEPGLIDWVKKNNRGEDVMQRIQWDIEAFAESVVTESFVAYTENSKGEYEVVKVLKDQRAAKAWRKKNAYLLDDESVDVKSIGTTPKKDWDKTHPELAIESTVNEEKIKYAKGKTYQSSGHWTVYVDSNSSGFDIRVNHSAGWRLDPHDEKEETLELLDNGRQRATIYFKSGNIDKFAQQMFDLNDRTTNGNQTKLTAKDYADIIRVWIDMKMANESSNGSVSLNPGMTTGGIGDPVLPTATTVGSGDMLAVADIDDDEEEAKKDKTKTKLEMEGFQLHTKFTNFIAESVVNEALSKEQKMVETFLNKIAKEYDYSIQDAVRFVKETISKMGLDESIVNEAVSRDTKIYQIATPAPQSMLLEELEELFGDDYRNIVTEFKEDEGYESVLMFNLSKSDIKKIEDNIADVLIWEYSIKKGKTITESIVTEAKFVKEFDEAVLKATTQEEVLEIYPNAEFFIGKSDHFFGEFDENLFFKAYYTKGQKEFEIKSIYSEKNSNYVHLYNESVVTEAKKLKPIKFSVKKSRKNPYTFSDKMDNDELHKLHQHAKAMEFADKEELDGYKERDYEKAKKEIFNLMMSRGANPYRQKKTWADDWKEEYDESVVTEAKAYKLKASEFGGDTHSAAYNVKGETTWRVHSTYAIDQVSGENNPEERDVVFFEAMPINNDIYIKIGGINNLKRTNGSTVGDNFGTTIEEWKKDPSGIAKEASDFLTDATHLKWINKKARSEGQVIKWALKDDYSSVIEDLVNKSLGLSEGIYAKQSKILPGEYIQTQYGYFYKRVEGQVGGQDAYVEIKKGKEGKKKTSIHDTVDFNIVDKSIALDESVTEDVPVKKSAFAEFCKLKL